MYCIVKSVKIQEVQFLPTSHSENVLKNVTDLLKTDRQMHTKYYILTEKTLLVA